MRHRILLLGGAGRAGRAAAELLLRHSEAEVVIAGRDPARAAAAADALERACPTRRASAVAVDATDGPGLRRALEGATLLFDCGPTATFGETLVRACLDAGVDGLDIHPGRSLAVLRALAPEVERAGRCFVTQAGLHPGLPATLMRHAAALAGGCRTVAGGMLFNVGSVPGPDAVVELIEILGDYRSLVWVDGAWRKPPWSLTRRVDFGPGLGPRTCYPMWSDELEGLPESLGLDEAGFYVAGFNWLADGVVTPLALALGSIRRGLGARPLARLLTFSVRHCARPPFAIVMVAEATARDGRTSRVVVRSDDDDGYRLTAAPAVACALQLLDGSIVRPGVHIMGQRVEPLRLAEDLVRMGIGVETLVR